jgi:hypothetical protein
MVMKRSKEVRDAEAQAREVWNAEAQAIEMALEPLRKQEGMGCYILAMTDAVRTGNAYWTARMGLYIARNSNETSKIIIDAFLKQSSKVANDAKRKHGTDQDEKIRCAVRTRLTDHPKDSVTYAGHFVAEQHLKEDGKPEKGWSWSKIRNAIRGMKK